MSIIVTGKMNSSLADGGVSGYITSAFLYLINQTVYGDVIK